jgi:hypothetical protein
MDFDALRGLRALALALHERCLEVDHVEFHRVWAGENPHK